MFTYDDASLVLSSHGYTKFSESADFGSWEKKGLVNVYVAVFSKRDDKGRTVVNQVQFSFGKSSKVVTGHVYLEGGATEKFEEVFGRVVDGFAKFV